MYSMTIWDIMRQCGTDQQMSYRYRRYEGDA